MHIAGRRLVPAAGLGRAPPLTYDFIILIRFYSTLLYFYIIILYYYYYYHTLMMSYTILEITIRVAVHH